MANTKITTNVIADDAITSAKIADDAVGNDQLASGLTLGGNTTATLSTAAQPNITSVGTLTSFRSTGIDDNADALAITIDSSENVGIGTTSPSRIFDVENSSASALCSIVSGTALKAGFLFGDTSADDQGGIVYDNNGDYLFFRTGGAERVRFDSAGKVHIGATSGTGILNVDGGSGEGSLYVEGTHSGSAITARLLASDGGAVFFGSSSNHDVRIQTNGSNRMTIDTSGNVGIGNTNPSGMSSNANKLVVGTGSGDQGMSVYAGTSTGRYAFARAVGDNTDAYDGGMAYDGSRNLTFHTNANAERMRITGSGAFFLHNIIGFSGANSDVRYDTSSGQIYYQTSSQRYKSEITNLEDSLNKIQSLRPVRFKDNHTEKFTTGLIAEEVVDIIPEVVFKKDIDGFDEQQPEGINYSDITPFLIKAIQEQQTVIEDLKSRIETLEG